MRKTDNINQRNNKKEERKDKKTTVLDSVKKKKNIHIKISQLRQKKELFFFLAALAQFVSSLLYIKG